MLTWLALALAVALALGGGGFPVQGAFIGRHLPVVPERSHTILIIYNHGFSGDNAGSYEPRLPPILEQIRERNADVVVYSQVRNTTRLEAFHHAAYIEAAVDFFHRQQHVPLGNIILAGQSCGAWGSLQTAALRHPNVGGIIAFAPTCHGKLPHPQWLRARRAEDIDAFARRLRAPGTLFVYEGDSFYSPDDWERVDSAPGPREAGLHVELLSRERVLAVCHACVSDSHSAVWGEGFADAFYASHLQPLIDRVRAGILARTR
jgi:dienelactone hydrolase